MIFGLEPRHPLPDGWTPLEAVTVLKCLDADGDVALVLSSTDGLNAWERVGMLTAVLDTSRDHLRGLFQPDDEEPDES